MSQKLNQGLLQVLASQSDGDAACNILDVRPASAFQTAHVTASSHIPWVAEEDRAPLDKRVFALPAPAAEEPFILVCDASTRVPATEYLRDRKYKLPDEHIIEWGDGVAQSLAQASLISTGMDGTRYLWAPAPFVKSHLEGVESRVAGRVAIDVGSGSGRDTVYLALRNWTVLAVDNLQRLLDNTTALAQHCHVGERVRTANVDLRYPDDLVTCQYDLVLVSRFLHRPLFPTLRSLTRPGGIVMYQQFLDGAQSIGKCTPKNPNRLLHAGELAREFGPDNGFSILADDCTKTEDGRPMNSFVAIKNSA